VVDAVLRELYKAGARSDGEQKFAMALGLSTARQGKSTSRSASHDGSLGGAVQFSISTGIDRLLDNDVLLRLQPSDPPVRAVHQARTAARRLRSDLKTFRPLLDAVWLDHTTTELKWLGNVLGRIRDADVLAHMIATGNSGTPLQASGQDELLSRLSRQRRTFSGDLVEALESGRYLSLLERLHAGAGAPPFYVNGQSPPHSAHALQVDRRASDMLPSLVRSQWKELRRRVRKAGRHPSDKQLHRIRIGSKQLRYAAEAAIPAVGNRARRTARQAERIQSILGAHHDAVAAEEWLRREAFRGTAVASFAAGGLVAEQQRRQRQHKAQWKSAWHRLKRKNKWLR
jgi:CHAD domain-containing protein